MSIDVDISYDSVNGECYIIIQFLEKIVFVLIDFVNQIELWKFLLLLYLFHYFNIVKKAILKISLYVMFDYTLCMLASINKDFTIIIIIIECENLYSTFRPA